MPQKKRKGQKKKRKGTNKTNSVDQQVKQRRIPVITEPCVPNQFEDNISLLERENVDLLETIDGIDYDGDQFKQDFPHLAGELVNAKLNYPIDSVRWEDETRVEDESRPPEEPNLDSLLRRSKTEEEAIEIIKYLEKRGEIAPQKAKKLIAKLKSKGLKAFHRKKGKK